MTRKLLTGNGPVYLLGVVLSVLSLPAAFGLDRRPTTSCPRPQPGPQRQPSCPKPPSRRRPPIPCPPPPCRPAKPDTAFEISIIRVDVDSAAVPTVNAVLASTSNPKDQLAGLQAQAKRGVPIRQVSYGPTLRVPQDATGTRDDDPAAPRSRVTAHPHLNASCAEAVDITVEQPPADPRSPGLRIWGSLVFENGDTKLLGETVHPDGARHLLYATVFFPPRPVLCPR